MKKIKLNHGKVAIVDDADYMELSKYKWYASFRYSACNYCCWEAKRRDTNKNKIVSMARVIMGVGSGVVIDHINGNTLDNRRENLRICSQANNVRNRKKSPGKSSKYKGVHWFKRTQRWQAYICFNYKNIHLGYFDGEKEAASAYNKAAVKYFGEFAKLNKVA